MRVWVIGVGPGDPSLLTLKAHELLSSCDAIFYTGSLIPKELIEKYNEGKIAIDTSKMTLEEYIQKIWEYASQGKKVCRVHDGDPSIYGALTEEKTLMEERGIEVIMVPGVSSFLGAAASLGIELTCPGGPQSVIITRLPYRTGDPDMMVLDRRATVVVFLSVHLIEKVKEKLLEVFPPETPVAVVYHATREDQVIVVGNVGSLDRDVKENRIASTALIIVSPCIKARGGRSHLYHSSFTHSYRRGMA